MTGALSDEVVLGETTLEVAAVVVMRGRVADVSEVDRTVLDVVAGVGEVGGGDGCGVGEGVALDVSETFPSDRYLPSVQLSTLSSQHHAQDEAGSTIKTM